MGKVTYTLKAYDFDKAKNGTLCVMVRGNVEEGEISNLDKDGIANINFVGAGICKYENLDVVCLTIQGTKYRFGKDGTGLYPWASYKIMLGTIKSNIVLSGNTSKSNNTTIVTRSSSGSTTVTTDYSKASDIIIDTLNARDEFAVQVLKELLRNAGNPAEVSDSEMSYYCDAAYQWAAYMMEASANARGTFQQDSSSSSDTTTKAAVAESSLSSNTEKLLNNIVSAIENEVKFMKGLKESFYDKFFTDNTAQLVSAIEALTEQVGKLTTAVSTRVSTVNKAINTINTDVEDLSDDVSSLSGSVSGLTTDVGTLNNNLTALENRVKALEDA